MLGRPARTLEWNSERQEEGQVNVQTPAIQPRPEVLKGKPCHPACPHPLAWLTSCNHSASG